MTLKDLTKMALNIDHDMPRRPLSDILRKCGHTHQHTAHLFRGDDGRYYACGGTVIGWTTEYPVREL